MNITNATLKLNDGHSIPQVGLGVWQTPKGTPTRRAVAHALAVGYRHVDTARIYNNETDVGPALADSGIPREQLFVTTKLWNADQGYDQALRACEASLERLKLDYVDLYLIHWPVAGKRLESWRALERLHEEGRARSIGVSNYLVPHLVELQGVAKVLPAVNQIELNPFLQRHDTVELCRKLEIVLEAYSPLTHGARLNHPVLSEVAKQVGRSVAQVLLRWGIQHQFVVLPKSVKEARITENAQVFDFELDEASMKRLDALEENLVTGWDPAGQA